MKVQPIILVFLLIFCCPFIYGQTKKISHKSHSGSKADFNQTFQNNLDGSNFGMAPDWAVYNAKLDSVIFVSDSLAILVTSNYRESHKNSLSSWKPGRELMHHHQLFSQKHSLDSIKQVLKSEYHFKNNIEEVVFIGYDNKNKEKEKLKENTAPLISIDNGENHGPYFFALLFTFFLSGMLLFRKSIRLQIIPIIVRL
ncbi:MAG: hypothetical protein H0X62_11460 [Bacteroidetes bacterium]|nr:hypothetical protein [Bacteroidota bacterium]